MKKFLLLIGLLMMVFFISSFESSAKATYTGYEKEYNISRCFLKSYNELSRNFNATKNDVVKLESLFETYQDPYLVIMIFEKGKKAIKDFDKGNYYDIAVKVCEKSQKYEEEWTLNNKFVDNLKLPKTPKKKRSKEDTGVTGKWIDLYIDNHKRCLQFGLKKKKVYIWR